MSRFTKNRVFKTSIIAVIIIAVGSLTYLFLWGKLFPYSPVKIGFSKQELSNIIIYVQNGTEHRDLSVIDGYIPAVAKWHELQFRRKPEIFVFRDRKSYLRRSVTKARFCAYPNGSVVISPWALKEAEEGKISLEIYLKHELSHTLLHQHMGIPASYIYFPRWLLEGIAMYSANQMGTSWYPGKKETYAYIKQGNFIIPSDYTTQRGEKTVLNVKYRIAFIYSEFGCIVDYLITTYGKEKFMEYMKQLLVDNNHDRVFKQIYGIGFDAFLQDFKRHVYASV